MVFCLLLGEKTSLPMVNFNQYVSWYTLCIQDNPIQTLARQIQSGLKPDYSFRGKAC